MGDPKKLRKKYSTPSHPWQRDRIAEENKLREEYGLKNKLEIWKANSLVKDLRNKARSYVVSLDEDSSKKSKEFVQKLYNLGLINSDDKGVDDILTLKVEDVLERRLETMMFKKKMVLTPKQARKFIVHKHVLVGDNVITAPGYLVSRQEEDKISFKETSPLFKETHSVRESVKVYYEKAALKVEEKVEDKKEESDKRNFDKRNFDKKSFDKKKFDRNSKDNKRVKGGNNEK